MQCERGELHHPLDLLPPLALLLLLVHCAVCHKLPCSIRVASRNVACKLHSSTQLGVVDLARVAPGIVPPPARLTPRQEKYAKPLGKPCFSESWDRVTWGNN